MNARERLGSGRESLTYEPAGFSIAQRRGPWRYALLRRMLALADVGAAVAVSASLGLIFNSRVDQMLWSAVFIPVWLLLAKIHGLYDWDQRALRHLTVDELPTIFVWATGGTALLALYLGFAPSGGLTAGSAVQSWLVFVITAFIFRSSVRGLWRWITPPARTVIVGEGPLAAATRRKLQLFPDIHVTLVGEGSDLVIEDLRSGGLDEIDRVILASQSIDEAEIAQLVRWCRRASVNLSVVPPARGMFGTAVQLNHVADLPVVEYNTWDVSRSTMLLKRILDVALASLAVVVLAPVLVLIGLAIKLDSRGLILFGQERAGQGGNAFRMLKFRTMIWNAEDVLPKLVSFDRLQEPMFKLHDDPRVTRVGRFLRRASLDELPQLVNVLKGNMSLVGPRPEQVELVERYTPEQLFRLTVKPGLSGPMQVYGRGQLTFEERLAVERDYIENLTLGRDLRILALTLSAVASGRGAF